MDPLKLEWDVAIVCVHVLCTDAVGAPWRESTSRTAGRNLGEPLDHTGLTGELVDRTHLRHSASRMKPSPDNL